jgi:hypothetical protein
MSLSLMGVLLIDVSLERASHRRVSHGHVSHKRVGETMGGNALIAECASDLSDLLATAPVVTPDNLQPQRPTPHFSQRAPIAWVKSTRLMS